MTIVDHLERHLGSVEEGWSTNGAGRKLPFLVVRLPGGPLPDRKVFATVGLSDHTLASRVSPKVIRQELVFIVPTGFGDRSIPGLVQQVGMEALETHSAYLRGDVIGPRGRLFDAGAMEALYVGVPVYLPASFATFTQEGGGAAVLSWLIPISAAEAAYVLRRGWESFEDELARMQPDLSDPERQGLITADVSDN